MKSSALTIAVKEVQTWVPGITVFIAVMASNLPFPIWGGHDVMPWWGLLAIFFWAIYRPESVPAMTLFIIGLMQDALTQTFFGFHALIYVGIGWLIQTQRRFFIKDTFLFVWFGAALVVIGHGLFTGGLWLFVSGTGSGLVTFGLRTLTTVALFPPLAAALMSVHRRLGSGR